MTKRDFLNIKTTAFALLISHYVAKADCTYDQLLKAEEFPVGVMLSWSTLSENNNSMFLLERSENGKDFSTVGTIKGSGNYKGMRKYNFLDVQPSSKKINYRLKQVDFDGTFSYSEVLTFDKKYQTNMMLVQMNSETVTKSFDFTVDALKDGGIVLQVTNGSGGLVWQGTKMVSQGLNTLSIDMSEMSDGVYKVSMMMEKDQKILTIRKAEEELNRMASSKKVGKN